MASKTLLTPEQYLAMHFDREPEYVHGELVEKPLPNFSHGKLQTRLGILLDHVGTGCVAVRMRLAEDLYRLPDFALFLKEPDSHVPHIAPLIAVEIQSPDDRIGDIEQKLEEYRVWGVKYIWFVEPEFKKLYTYDRGLMNVAHFELPEFGITITPGQLFGPVFPR
jgi:Uma2 family endonuclease